MTANIASQEFTSLKLGNFLIPEDNLGGIDIFSPESQGIFVSPSIVPGRPNDITGYVLTAVNSEGKVQWEISQGSNLALGDLTDVDLSGLQNGDVIIYDINTDTWIPSSNSSSIPGIALSKLGNVLNVNVDNIAIGVNLNNELQVNPSSITNAMLVNNFINFIGLDGINVFPNPIQLGDNLDIGVDNTVLRTFGNQLKNGDLEIIGTLTANVLTDGTLTINSGNINEVLNLSFIETGGGTDQITISAPTNVSVGGYSIKLPSTQGTVSSILLNDGFGNLSWVPSSTTLLPGGVQYSIQYNDPLNSFAGNSNFLYNGTDVTLNGGEMNAVAFNATSDATLKTNIKPLKNCLYKINQIEGYQYNWKSCYSTDTKKQYGVLAQELINIGLKDITHDNGQHKSVNYNKIIPFLIGSIKELTEKIENLEKTIQSFSQ